MSENQKNKFYLNGGEKVKLGRVMMKIIEVNIDPEIQDDRSSNNTEMSFRDIDQQPELRATHSDNNGPFDNDFAPRHAHRSPSATSQTDLRLEEVKEHVKGLGIGPLDDHLNEQSID